ncbi:MAG: hypothetical protein I4E98_21550, partial [Planktothrix agardhii KL2]
MNVMTKKELTDEEIRAEMDEIDRLELQGGCSAASSGASRKAKKASEGQKKIKTVPPAVVAEDEDVLGEGETLKEWDERMAKKYPKRSYDDLTEEE